LSKLTDVTKGELLHNIRNGFKIPVKIQHMDEYERIFYVEDSEHVYMPFHGKNDLLKFFDRVYNLKTLKSTDSRYSNAEGDIWQHTINNDDWESDWFWDYEPFNLNNPNDKYFLKFLTEIFHPAVRDEDQPWKEYLKKFNELLKYDGYEIYCGKKISGRQSYNYREIALENSHIVLNSKEIIEQFNSSYINSQIQIMLDSVKHNPYEAIGKAKELLESCCKTILDKYDVKTEKNIELSKLMKKTTKILKLTPKNIDDSKKASETIKKILGSLGSVSQGLAELRNSYGGGHGKASGFIGLNERHANLAVGSSVTFVRFLWDTFLERKSLNE
jgi:hypothetical protein